MATESDSSSKVPSWWEQDKVGMILCHMLTVGSGFYIGFVTRDMGVYGLPAFWLGFGIIFMSFLGITLVIANRRRFFFGGIPAAIIGLGFFFMAASTEYFISLGSEGNKGIYAAAFAGLLGPTILVFTWLHGLLTRRS